MPREQVTLRDIEVREDQMKRLIEAGYLGIEVWRNELESGTDEEE